MNWMCLIAWSTSSWSALMRRSSGLELEETGFLTAISLKGCCCFDVLGPSLRGR